MCIFLSGGCGPQSFVDIVRWLNGVRHRRMEEVELLFVVDIHFIGNTNKNEPDSYNVNERSISLLTRKSNSSSAGQASQRDYNI
jgi:hypothetical protein